MAQSLDYIIYMTYDLHGQWDYGNKWTSPGCETGNCLRSHVNETETKDALSMITKAGAPSDKVVVGVASYGRSFKMAKENCDSEDCKFTGSPRVSNAKKGRCTDTAGYISNAEINEILTSGQSIRHWTTEGSDIMVYDDTEWVAWMSEDTKKKRSVFYDEYDFAGTTDWAVDLQSFIDGTGDGDEDNEYIDPNWFSSCRGSYYQTLEQLEEMKDKIPVHCMDVYILALQITLYEETLKKYEDLIDSGYDKKFEVYKRFVEDQAPDQINNFMASDKVDKYFSCKQFKRIKCCSSCMIPQCREDCDDSQNCKAGDAEVGMDKCPKMEFKDKGLDVHQIIPNTIFTLKDSDGFYKDIADTWGIEESWIRFDKRLMRINNGCQYAGTDVLACQLRTNNYTWNYPMGNANIEVYNPKK